MATAITYAYEDASDAKRYVKDSELNFTGDWSASPTYGFSDVVDFTGSQWIALTAHTNQTPPASIVNRDTYWSILVVYDESTFQPGSTTVTTDGLGTPI